MNENLYDFLENDIFEDHYVVIDLGTHDISGKTQSLINMLGEELKLYTITDIDTECDCCDMKIYAE